MRAALLALTLAAFAALPARAENSCYSYNWIKLSTASVNFADVNTIHVGSDGSVFSAIYFEAEGDPILIQDLHVNYTSGDFLPPKATLKFKNGRTKEVGFPEGVVEIDNVAFKASPVNTSAAPQATISLWGRETILLTGCR